MSLLRCITDWTGPSGWDAAKRARKCDLWDLFWTATAENTAMLPGKKIIAFQPAVPIMANGQVVDHPYARELAALVERFHAGTTLHLFNGADGGYLELIDITKPRFVVALAQLRHQFFGWADGHKFDYFCRPDSLNIRDAVSVALVPWSSDYLEAWDHALSAFTAACRALKPDAILVGQNDRLLGDTWSAMSGQYIEQRWDFNGRTAQVHAEDIDRFNSQMRRIEPQRRLVSVLELRDPSKLTRSELDLASAWCVAQGIYLSVGRDGTALGA